MVPGPTKTEIKNDHAVMILSKHSADEIMTSFSPLPAKHGFDEGAVDIQSIPTTDAIGTDLKVVHGMQASDASDAIDVMEIILYVVGSL